MGKVTGFLELDRVVESYRDVDIRINDYDEIFTGDHNLNQLQEQGSRCMDCGVPFCQSLDGCPIDNLIPEWNDLVYKSNYSFKPIQGKTYHLYQKDDDKKSLFLSIIGPDEWDMLFIGSFKLMSNNKWEKIDE